MPEEGTTASTPIPVTPATWPLMCRAALGVGCALFGKVVGVLLLSIRAAVRAPKPTIENPPTIQARRFFRREAASRGSSPSPLPQRSWANCAPLDTPGPDRGARGPNDLLPTNSVSVKA